MHKISPFLGGLLGGVLSIVSFATGIGFVTLGKSFNQSVNGNAFTLVLMVGGVVLAVSILGGAYLGAPIVPGSFLGKFAVGFALFVLLVCGIGSPLGDIVRLVGGFAGFGFAFGFLAALVIKQERESAQNRAVSQPGLSVPTPSTVAAGPDQASHPGALPH